MKNISIIIASILISISVNAEHYFKIPLKKLDKDQNIIVTSLTGLSPVDPVTSVNDNDPADINTWALFLQNNVEPYNGFGSGHYDPNHPTAPITSSSVSMSTLSTKNISIKQEGGEEGGEGEGEGEGEFCASSQMTIEEIENYMQTTGFVYIQSGYSEPMPTVTGLNNVIHQFEIQNSNITALTGIENITHITDGILFFQNDNLTNYSALSNLQETRQVSLMFNPSIDISFLSNMTKGDLDVYGTQITNIQSLNPNLECERFTLSGAELNSIDYPNLANIFQNGCTNIRIDINNLTNVNSFSGITEFDDLILDRNDLTDISGLSDLVRVNNTLDLSSNPNLVDLTPLSNLTYVEGGLYLSNTGITTFTGLENLTTIGQILHLYEHESLVNLNGLESLTEIGGLFLIRPTSLNNIDGLQNLTTVNQSFSMEDVNVPDFSALSNLETVGGNFDISSPTATNLTGLENLRTVGGRLGVWMPNLRDISALNNLESLDGRLYINYGYNMSIGKLRSDHFICQNIEDKVYFGYNVTPSQSTVNTVRSRLCES